MKKTGYLLFIMLLISSGLWGQSVNRDTRFKTVRYHGGAGVLLTESGTFILATTGAVTNKGWGLNFDAIIFRKIASYPELHKDSYSIYNNGQLLHNTCFPGDTIKRLSMKELRQLSFLAMPDSALRINFVNFRNKGIERLVIGGIVVGAALVGIASGIKNLDILTGEGTNLIAASFVFGGSLSVLPFISAGRNFRKAKRIRKELNRRGQM